MKYVTDYTGFSGETSEQSGNYLAIHCETVEPVDSITVELKGGSTAPKALDTDGIAIIRVTDKDTETIEVVAHKGSNSKTKTYSLEGLTLESED